MEPYEESPLSLRYSLSQLRLQVHGKVYGMALQAELGTAGIVIVFLTVSLLETLIATYFAVTFAVHIPYGQSFQ